MTGRYRLTPLAEADLDAAASWYAQRSPNAATGFLLAAQEAFQRAAQSPDHAPEIIPGVRRRNLKGYPFGAWYIPRGYGSLVIAVLHHRQNPRVIQARHDLKP